MDSLLKTDVFLTEWIHKNIGMNKNPVISKMPYYLGLLPYELYVLPGMFVAIFAMFYYKTFHPVQFHLLPHWFAFSISLYIKHNVHRTRPGCAHPKTMGHLIDPNHCLGKTKFESFPSGHTIIAFTLATTLHMYLTDPTYEKKDKSFLGIDFSNDTIKNITIGFAYLVAIMISIHRVSYGYHHVSDVLVGAIMGYAIGFTSYSITNLARGVQLADKTEEQIWFYIRIFGCIASVLAILHFFVFKFHKLSMLQH